MRTAERRRCGPAAAAAIASLLAACGVGVVGAPPAQPGAAPVISVQPGIQYVKPGDTATFTVVAGGAGPIHYQWARNGVNVGGDAPAYTTPAVTAANNGEKYRVVVSNAAGSVTSGEATLTVNASDLPATIQSQPQGVTVTAGEAATFTVVASGTSPLRYQWKRNGANVGGNLAGYTTPATTLADDGASYTVDVSNALTSVTSSAARLTVNAAQAAPTITTQPQSATVTEGGEAVLGVVASGTGPLHYQWRHGTAAVGADAASLTLRNVQLADAGSYTVTVTNAVGGVTSGAATLTVKALTTVSVAVTPANVTLAVGATQAFAAAVTGSGNKAVTWTAGSGTITADGVYTAPAAAGNDVVRATSQADGTRFGEATVRVIAAGHQLRVLFLGNSFTNEHDLDAQVMGLAKAAGVSLYAEKYTVGAADLRTLWNDPVSLQTIRQEGGWDYVVLQPFWHAYGTITKEQELVYAQNFDAEIKKIGAKTVIFCTWALGWGATGDSAYDHAKEEAADLGNLWMAQQLGAQAVRVGDAWQVLYERYPVPGDPSQTPQPIPLYQSDACHPTNTGHYFTAALFLVALTGASPVGNAYLPPPSPDAVSPAHAAILQALAWELR